MGDFWAQPVESLVDQGFTPLHKHVMVNGTPVNAVAATTTLTDGNLSNMANGSSVSLDGKLYTFVTGPVTTEGDILIGTAADDTLLNLANAIGDSTGMQGGTPNTDYQAAAAHPSVSASTSVSSHAITLTAKTKGAAGNSLPVSASTSPNSHVTVGHSGAFVGGVDGTVGTPWEERVDASYQYTCIGTQTVADTNWRRVSLGSAY